MYYCDTINIIPERIIQEPDEIMVENFDVRRVNNFKDVEELAVDTYLVSLIEFTYLSILSCDRKCLVKKTFINVSAKIQPDNAAENKIASKKLFCKILNQYRNSKILS